MTTNDTRNTLNYGDSATIKTAQTNSDDTRKIGYYFVKLKDGKVTLAWWREDVKIWAFCEHENVVEVLAPCDYEELQRLKEENKSLIKEYQAKQIDLTNLFNENEQLRQLLKECMEEFQDFNNPSYHTVENLFTRINAAIGESEE